MTCQSLATFGQQTKKMSVNLIHFTLPRPPPGTYFDPLYPAQIDLVPGQPKIRPGLPHFRAIFHFFFHFWHLATHFYPLFWPQNDPGTLLKRTGTKFSIQWYQYDVRKRVGSDFIAKSLNFSGPIFGPIILVTPTTLYIIYI